MPEMTFVILGATLGIVVLASSAILLIRYRQRHRRDRSSLTLAARREKRKDRYAARSISFVSHEYHYNMTLLASPRRLEAILEQQSSIRVPSQTSTHTNSSVDSTNVSTTGIVQF